MHAPRHLVKTMLSVVQIAAPGRTTALAVRDGVATTAKWMLTNVKVLHAQMAAAVPITYMHTCALVPPSVAGQERIARIPSMHVAHLHAHTTVAVLNP